MRKKTINFVLVTMLVFLLSLVADSFITESDVFYQDAVAPSREFEENITIPINDMASLNLAFSQGDELELIFTVEVIQNLPIDVWFVNYANYVRLADGNEFLYFLDGSDQQVKQATKAVSVTQHGTYILVMANYNNVSVDVHLTYDINTYPEDGDTSSDGSDKGEEIPLWKEFYVMLPLGLIIGILVGLLGARFIGRSGKGSPKAASKAPSKNVKKRRARKKAVPASAAIKKKVEKRDIVVEKKMAAKEPEEPEVAKKTPSEESVEKAASPRFCGNCGSPVETKFCPSCGEKVGKD